MVAYAQTVTDRAGLTGSGLFAAGPAGDREALTDTITQASTTGTKWTRTITDSEGMPDTGSFAQTGANTVGLSDSISVNKTGVGAWQVPLTNPAGLTDSRAQAKTTVRTVTDAAGLSDTIGYLGTVHANAITDGEGLADVPGRTVIGLRPLTETEAGRDVMAAGAPTNYVPGEVDTSGLADRPAQTVVHQRTVGGH
jgi:hypothetical protein